MIDLRGDAYRLVSHHVWIFHWLQRQYHLPGIPEDHYKTKDISNDYVLPYTIEIFELILSKSMKIIILNLLSPRCETL